MLCECHQLATLLILFSQSPDENFLLKKASPVSHNEREHLAREQIKTQGGIELTQHAIALGRFSFLHEAGPTRYTSGNSRNQTMQQRFSESTPHVTEKPMCGQTAALVVEGYPIR